MREKIVFIINEYYKFCQVCVHEGGKERKKNKGRGQICINAKLAIIA